MPKYTCPADCPGNFVEVERHVQVARYQPVDADGDNRHVPPDKLPECGDFARRQKKVELLVYCQDCGLLVTRKALDND